MSTTYAGRTLADIKEAAEAADPCAAREVLASSDIVLAMVARIEELEREHHTARLEGFHTARLMAARQCDSVAAEFYSAAANRCASGIRAMQPPAEWSGVTDVESSRPVTSPTEADWPHPDGFPAIAGMP
ncbi:hypothetical protein [Pseudogulbenkiania sp. MAI-1]|uniref:hypothetical protein n=1 Tax=Pseudogulbenkiania sp. MAI-1 TaxID=990370 RepID=UPI00045E6E60|nr:hypothetical protein [Pseudogulbenkiania sp. MAI-1]